MCQRSGPPKTATNKAPRQTQGSSRTDSLDDASKRVLVTESGTWRLGLEVDDSDGLQNGFIQGEMKGCPTILHVFVVLFAWSKECEGGGKLWVSPSPRTVSPGRWTDFTKVRSHSEAPPAQPAVPMMRAVPASGLAGVLVMDPGSLGPVGVSTWSHTLAVPSAN